MLALFVPLIISSGGNSGSQASTLVIRALALGEVGLARLVARHAARDRGRPGARRASSAASASSASRSGRRSPTSTASTGCSSRMTVAIALVGVVLWGTLIGSLLPFLLRRLGFDPATSSAPFVATLVDVTGLVIYFSVGTGASARHAVMTVVPAAPPARLRRGLPAGSDSASILSFASPGNCAPSSPNMTCVMPSRLANANKPSAETAYSPAPTTDAPRLSASAMCRCNAGLSPRGNPPRRLDIDVGEFLRTHANCPDRVSRRIETSRFLYQVLSARDNDERYGDSHEHASRSPQVQP